MIIALTIFGRGPDIRLNSPSGRQLRVWVRSVLNNFLKTHITPQAVASDLPLHYIATACRLPFPVPLSDAYLGVSTIPG